MSAATIGEPFLLSSYPESPAYKKRKVTPLYASIPSGSNADPFVTVAVQGDGIHVLDASELHSAASHTLGPSTSFSCSPSSRTTQAKGEGRTCKTYAVLETGPDVKTEGSGGTVVIWEEHLGGMSSNVDGTGSKRVVAAPHPVACIYAPDFLPQNVVLVGPSGSVTIANDTVQEPRTFTPQNHQPSSLLKHFLLPATACSFLPPQTLSAFSAISLSFLRSGDILRLSIVGVHSENVTLLGECVVPLEDKDIIDISCGASGFIGVLLLSGTLLAFSLIMSPSSSLSISPLGDPLRLQNLTFINTTRSSEASLAALTSSHAILCAVSTGSVPEIVFLLWDLRYGVLLAQQSMPVPSSLPRPKKYGAILRVQAPPVIPATPGASKASSVNMNAVLTLLPSPEREHQADAGSAAARSAVLVVPLTLPVASTIAAAMGRAHAGARWVSTKTVQGPGVQGHTPRGAPELSAAARKTLKEIKIAIEGSSTPNAAAAETAFFEYVKVHGKRKNTARGQGAVAVEVSLEYPFVQGALDLVLPAPSLVKGQTPAIYSPKIIKHLLDSRAITASMVKGGLLPALAAQHDWESISLALRNVTDLPESDLILLLSQVVTEHRKSSQGNENLMQVDTASTAPSLPAFLVQCILYPATPSQQRAALRKHLPDAADLLPVLEILDHWIAQHTTDADMWLSSHDNITDGDTPPLGKTLAFAQTLLDASFLTLLSHTPAHILLRALAGHLAPALTGAGQLEPLYGPLAPFARAASAKARGQAGAKDDGKADGGREWRRKRKAVHEQAGMSVGAYQIEELSL